MHSLHSLRHYELVIPQSVDGLILTNHFLGSKPRSAFLHYLLQQADRFTTSYTSNRSGSGATAVDALTQLMRSIIACSPYLEVFYSTGPIFLTQIFYEYYSNQKEQTSDSGFVSTTTSTPPSTPPSTPQSTVSVHSSRVAVLTAEFARRYVTHYAGRSWHSLDGKVINWIGDHFSLPGLALCAFILIVLILAFRSVIRRDRKVA